MTHDVRLTMGHLLQHAPRAGTPGLEAALIDVAQDLLLRDLHERDLLGDLAFKGGTALRKLFAGSAGRFSTDLDFSVRSTEKPLTGIVERLVESIRDVRCGPFRYGIQLRRGKPHVTIESDLGQVDRLQCKLDVSPPPWLPAQLRPWVPMPIHSLYGGTLPELPVMQIEENVAEKIARLNRVTPARDVYDLVWVMRNRAKFGRDLEPARIRRLTVLKVWVDANGLRTAFHAWKPAHEPRPLDVDRWLRERRADEFDDEFIGLLAAPPPSLEELGRALADSYEFLRALTREEAQLAGCSGRDRPLFLRLLAELPGTCLPQGSCW